MLITTNIDSRQYNEKPTDLAFLSKRLRNSTRTITVKELAEALGQGQTILSGVYNGSMSPADFEGSQIIAIDFDNTYPVGHPFEGQRFRTNEIKPEYQYMTIKKVLQDEFTLGNGAFIYKTFSYDSQHEKFRLVFILSHIITNVDQFKELYDSVLDHFPSADKVVGQPNRIFFGGSAVVEIDHSNRLDSSLYAKGLSNLSALGKKKSFVAQGAPVYKLIKEGNHEAVKDKWSRFQVNVSSRSQFIALMKQIDLVELLEVQNYTHKSIIRMEENPSCSVYRKDNGNYLYKDFAVNKNYDLFTLIQCLAPYQWSNGISRKLSYSKAVNLVLELTGSSISLSEKLKDIYIQFDDFKDILLSDELQELHPEIYKIFGRYGYVSHVNAIIDIFKSKVYETEQGQIAMSWLSVENLSKRLGIGKDKTNSLLKLMTLVNIVELLPEAKIPAEILKIINTNQLYYTDKNGALVRRERPRERKSNVYSLFQKEEFLEQVEEGCDTLIDKGFTMKGLSREWVLRNLGQAEANRVYPQDAHKKQNKKADKFMDKAVQIAQDSIQSQGFIIINELKEAVRNELGLSINQRDFKWKQVENDLIQSYGFQKVRLNKQLKSQLGIHSALTSAPMALIK